MNNNLQPVTEIITFIVQGILGIGVIVYTVQKLLHPILTKHVFKRNFLKTVQKEAAIQEILQAYMQEVVDEGKQLERLHVYVLHNGKQNVLGQCEMAFTCMYERCRGGVQAVKETLQRLQTADHAWLIRELCIKGVPVYANTLEYIKDHQGNFDSSYAVIARQGMKSFATAPLYRGNEIMGFVMSQYSEEDQVDEQCIRDLCILSGRLTSLIFTQKPSTDCKASGSPLEI